MAHKLDIMNLMYHRAENLLTVCLSDIKDFNILDKVRSYEVFEIQGRREARRYMFAGAVRDHATNEIGDIRFWVFRPADGYGRYQPGPSLHVFND